jgi:hypothetical protein
MRRTSIRAICLAVVLSMVSAGAANAGDEARRRGACSGGPGDWTLRVRREDAGRLRVRFTIDDVPAGQTWQLFLSDDGARIFSGTRISNDPGEVRVRTYPANRPGSDRIAASGINTMTGTTCEGSLTY